MSSTRTARGTSSATRRSARCLFGPLAAAEIDLLVPNEDGDRPHDAGREVFFQGAGPCGTGGLGGQVADRVVILVVVPPQRQDDERRQQAHGGQPDGARPA